MQNLERDGQKSSPQTPGNKQVEGLPFILVKNGNNVKKSENNRFFYQFYFKPALLLPALSCYSRILPPKSACGLAILSPRTIMHTSVKDVPTEQNGATLTNLQTAWPLPSVLENGQVPSPFGPRLRPGRTCLHWRKTSPN